MIEWKFYIDTQTAFGRKIGLVLRGVRDPDDLGNGEELTLGIVDGILKVVPLSPFEDVKSFVVFGDISAAKPILEEMAKVLVKEGYLPIVELSKSERLKIRWETMKLKFRALYYEYILLKQQNKRYGKIQKHLEYLRSLK